MVDHTENECYHPFAFSLWLIDHRGVRFLHEFPYFHIVARRDFHAIFSITLYNGASIRKYKAHWNMNFSLISGFDSRENNIRGHSFF